MDIDFRGVENDDTVFHQHSRIDLSYTHSSLSFC